MEHAHRDIWDRRDHRSESVNVAVAQSPVRKDLRWRLLPVINGARWISIFAD